MRIRTWVGAVVLRCAPVLMSNARSGKGQAGQERPRVRQNRVARPLTAEPGYGNLSQATHLLGPPDTAVL